MIRSTPTPDVAGQAAQPQVAVRLEGVVKRFGDDEIGRRVATFVEGDGTFPVVAVAGIDLDVYDGEFFSMLGPSGSGKTTTLRMIAGSELPSDVYYWNTPTVTCLDGRGDICTDFNAWNTAWNDVTGS